MEIEIREFYFYSLLKEHSNVKGWPKIWPSHCYEVKRKGIWESNEGKISGSCSSIGGCQGKGLQGYQFLLQTAFASPLVSCGGNSREKAFTRLLYTLGYNFRYRCAAASVVCKYFGCIIISRLLKFLGTLKCIDMARYS